MNEMISKSLLALLISLLLLICTPLTSTSAQQSDPRGQEPTSSVTGTSSPETESQILENLKTLEDKVQLLEQRIDGLKPQIENLKESQARNKDNQKNGLLDYPWPLWLTTGSLLVIAIVAMWIAKLSLTRSKRLLEEVQRLKGKHQSMLTRLGGIELHLEQERIANRNQIAATPTLVPTTLADRTPPADPTPFASNWPIAQPPALPISEPTPISKSVLVNALNSSDRQQLRQAAKAELNITNESENALAMGKSIATQLEEVTAGGSYWLIFAEGSHWLFPTERTLKGFAAAQPQKGLFRYEPQIIPQPRLIEPALLEQVGAHWQVKTLGSVATP